MKVTTIGALGSELMLKMIIINFQNSCDVRSFSNKKNNQLNKATISFCF